MRFEYYLDTETGEPHIYRHDVSEEEVEEAFANEGIEWHAGDGKWVSVSKTDTGRMLQIVYLRTSAETVLIITAYRPKKELLAAYRREMKKNKEK